MDLNYLDIILALLLIWSAWSGFRKGFVYAICTLLAFGLGIWGGIYLSGYTADFLHSEFNTDPEMMPIIAFAATFIIIVILVHLVGKLIEKIVNLTALGLLNKISGALFGIIKTSFILSIFFMIGNSFSSSGQFPGKDITQDARIYPYILMVAPTLIPHIQNNAWWDKLQEQAEEILPKAQENIIL